jgi:hypothetical protein
MNHVHTDARLHIQVCNILETATITHCISHFKQHVSTSTTAPGRVHQKRKQKNSRLFSNKIPPTANSWGFLVSSRIQHRSAMGIISLLRKTYLFPFHHHLTCLKSLETGTNYSTPHTIKSIPTTPPPRFFRLPFFLPP